MPRKKLIPTLIFFLLCLATPANSQGPSIVVNSAFVIRPGQAKYFQFHVSQEGTRIAGRFRSADNIEVYIMDVDSFENWMNGATVNTYYSSGRITVSNINTSLPIGNYILVFNNRYSIISNKAVTASIYLIYPTVPTTNPQPQRNYTPHSPGRSEHQRTEAFYDENGRMIELGPLTNSSENEDCRNGSWSGVITLVKLNSVGMVKEFTISNGFVA